MSVDLGKARTGIAVSDSGESFAFPKEVITEKNETRLVEKLADAAIKYAAEMIVVGYPRNMNGTVGSSAQECAHTAELLTGKVTCPVELWDERCTTVSAHTALNFTDTKGKNRKAVIDAVAATMILQDYLDYRKNTRNRG